MTQDIDLLAEQAVAFLIQNKEAAFLNFVGKGSYPRNACEGVSFLFKYLLEFKLGRTDAVVIKGTNKDYEHHFWVLIDGLIYDLTAHQFEDVGAPVIGGHDPRYLDAFFQTEPVLETPDFDREDVRHVVLILASSNVDGCRHAQTDADIISIFGTNKSVG